MTKAVCKFECVGVRPSDGDPDTSEVSMTTSYDPDAPEDTKFSRFTPWGDLSFGVSNPALEGFFKPGQRYLITIEPAE